MNRGKILGLDFATNVNEVPAYSKEAVYRAFREGGAFARMFLDCSDNVILSDIRNIWGEVTTLESVDKVISDLNNRLVLN